ncbi:MAG: toll/interleukin-1 receptor domain-containing protein [Fimbriimonadaceae bacterium]|nr:toll/interleukin-1 receptor domain-containing protein [Fimbriimonadaceae bacterium]
MASIRQYFETDFPYALRVHGTIRVDEEAVEAAVLYDLSGYSCFLAVFVEGQRKRAFYERLLEKVKWGGTEIHFSDNITLPLARFHPGSLTIGTSEGLEITSQFFGMQALSDTRLVSSSRRIFIYAECDISVEDQLQLVEVATLREQSLELRTPLHAEIRSRSERPFVFISYDSGDRDVAIQIARSLDSFMCPVWYDEFSLKVGDNLRESIEKGLKQCRYCILLLSPRYFANTGWTKTEFDSVFAKGLHEDRAVILPVWHGVGPAEVYEYSPSLKLVVGLNWASLGADEVCRRLHQKISSDPEYFA